MEVKEKDRYRFSTRTGVLADTTTGRPLGRVLRVEGARGIRWAARCNCHPVTPETIDLFVHHRTRAAAVAGLVAHLDHALVDAEVSA